MPNTSSSESMYTKEIFNDPDYEPSAKHLNALYGSTISALNAFGINDTGYICREIGGTLTPIVVNEKEWVLPTRTNLRREDNDELQFFHPLSENIMRGESLIISTLLKYITMDINVSMVYIINEMAGLLSDDTHIERMNTDQVTMARKVGFSDAKFIAYAKSVTSALIGKFKEKEYPISFFLKPKALINEKTYSRGCIVNFELDSLYDDMDNKYAGVKEKKKGYALTMHKLVQSIFPNNATVNAYSYGTYSSVAPYFCALVGGWVNMKRAINEYCEVYRDLGLFEDSCITDLSWYGGETGAVAYEGALKALSGLIPALDGNVGSGGKLGADVAPDADRAKLMSSFLENMPVKVGDRSEGNRNVVSQTEDAPEPEYAGMINPALLARPKPANTLSSFSNQGTQSGFGNSWNNPPQQSSPFGNNQSGFGNSQSAFGNNGGFGGSFNNQVQCTPTSAARATAHIKYDGPKF